MNVHLVAFNVPFPANYGGVIDVFYKVKALKEIGVKVHLHCFLYGRIEAIELEKICEKVFYYKRNTSIFQQLSILPYIVKSRKNALLLKNLMENDYPIIFEGLHCCGFMNSSELTKRLKIVRMHNIEWQYYEHLVSQASNIINKLFFQLESWRLKAFEKKLKADYLLTISPNDTSYFKKRYANIPSVYVPAFHGNTAINSKIGTGVYFLFHGDLSVTDNEKAALYLIEEVFNDLEIKLIIAGLNPTERLLAKASEKVEIQANLSTLEMQNLIVNAQANVLISYHSAGMKLKLLNALYNGRFCIVNTEMIKGLDLGKLVLVGDNSTDLKGIIKEINTVSFSDNEIEIRKKLLQNELNDFQNARKIKELLINNN
jgi:hypothetical protein